MKDYKIALVNPQMEPGSSFFPKNSDIAEYMYPYSLVFLQNYLLKYGLSAEIFDLYDTDSSELFQYCRAIPYLITGVTTLTVNRFEAIKIIQEVKKIAPSSILVVGGKHFSYCAQDTLEHIKEIDIIVRGEGEITFFELVKALRDENDFTHIDGISFRKSGEIVHNRDRNPESDIDQFSLDYNKLPLSSFAKGVLLQNFERENIRSLPVILGRGCNQKCVFCSYNKFSYRSRSLGNVMNEIIFLVNKFGVTCFTFSDPSFCERREFVKEFCDRLIRDKLNIKWYCEARADTPLELLRLMVKAGCVSLDFALESGSPNVLKTIRKKVIPAQVLSFAKECHRLRIRSLVYAMVSLPEETEDDAMQTLAILKQLSHYVTHMALGVTNILPGTELEIIAKRKGILPPDFSWYDRKFDNPFRELANLNIPLYIEKLSVSFLKDFLKKTYDIATASFRSFSDFLRMILKGLKRAGKQPVSATIGDVLLFIKRIWIKLS